jgi:16S rRNA (guanine966-N2)-methyltransferase
MRIIAGEFRSRRLRTLPGLALRPTPDRLRETLFNILSPQIEGAVFLDAYAGTGAVGIEALSRGAAHAIFLEKHRSAVKLIQENIASLAIQERATVIAGSALPLLATHPADIVFLDPPYDLEGEYADAVAVLGQTATLLVVAQHSIRFSLAEDFGRLHRFRVLKQGDNALSFFAPQTEAIQFS